jgi:phosphoribosyl-dephospho-CoA transferase
MPVITDATEKRNWLDLLTHCARGNKEITNYFRSSGGPLLSFGIYIDGYLKVGLNSETPEKVNDSVIDEIYRTIDEAAQEEGVNNVPVVFLWSEPGHEDDAIYSPSGEKLENESTQDEDKSTQTTPGFTSIMFVLCILILAIFRKQG